MHTRHRSESDSVTAAIHRAEGHANANMLNDLRSQLGHRVNAVRNLFDRPVRAPQRRADGEAPGSAMSLQQREDRQARVRVMQADLRQLLDQHPTARQLMRHLALLEFTLRYKGLTAMQALPTPVITQALNQLEKLVWDWSVVGLADLRSRLAVIVKGKLPDLTAPADTAPSMHQPHVVDAPLATEVTEVDHAAFEAMERSWAGQIPKQAPQAGAAG
jgi:hypothetical protein